MSVLKNKYFKSYFIMILWCLPIFASLNMISNMSKSATETNKKTFMASIPESCDIKDEKLICGDQTFSKEAMQFIQDVKYQSLSNLDNVACRVVLGNKNIVKDFLPVKYVTHSEDSKYNISVACFKNKAIHNNILDYASTKINKEYAELQSCKKQVMDNSTIVNINGKFKVAKEGVSYICESIEPMLFTKKEMFKHFFIQECSLRLIEEKESPFKTCESLYSVFSNPELKETKYLNKNNDNFEAMDFLNMIDVKQEIKEGK